MRTVGVVTVGRSDYGIYRPVLDELRRRDDLEPLLFVGGAHLVERFGRTVEEIERDGYPIAERVEFLGDDDSPAGIATSLGRGVEAFAAAFERTRPDILLLLGDRFEMLAAGLAALPLALPVAHVHGGELTEGLIDEAARHSLTKVSHLHFASTEEYARRIVQLGEEPWRVTVTGAPSLDVLREFAPLSDDGLAARGVHLRGPTLLVTYHPVTLDHARTGDHLQAVLDAVDASGLDAVFTYPNADTSHGQVIEALESFVDRSDNFTLVRNLGTDAYFTLMSRATAMVGNSSSGIIEAASFHLPVVDIGMRQQGRVRAANVLHAEPTAASIEETLKRATAVEFRNGLNGLVNPYGDGHASERIVDKLATVDLDQRLLVKRFHDL